MLPVVFLIILVGVIWYLGTGRFGREQSQAWIDRVNSRPRLNVFLNKHHGKFRASVHYFEFGGMFLVLYWCADTWLGDGDWRWRPLWGLGIALASAVAAHFDEVHQLKSGTRQYRRVDFLHSCCGIAIAALLVAWQDLLGQGF